jgi:alginate production protein
VQNAILVVLILLVSVGTSHAQLVGGTSIAIPADEPKTYEDDISDLEDFFELFPGEHLHIPLSEARYKVTEEALEEIKPALEQRQSEDVAHDIVEKLEALKDQEFIGKETFLNQLKITIGEAYTEAYQSLILKYALSGPNMILGPEIDSTYEYRKGFTLNAPANRDAPANDDDSQLEQELSLELFFYPLANNLALLLQGKLLYTALLDPEDNQTDLHWDFKRDESWLYIRKLFGSDFSLQIGRPSFLDKREWWWNTEVDAVRFLYDRDTFHVQASVAQEMAPISVRADGIDPNEKDVLRVFGHTAWEWRESDREAHWLEGFFLYQHDHSGSSAMEAFVPANLQDESDADLSWVGLRALGSIQHGRLGRFDYWLDVAGVVGHEVVFSFDDDGIVEERRTQDVAGWAIDVGLTWQANLPAHPALTLGYAVGSGDSRPESGTDHAFRQTGLQDNNDFFGGTFRFHYYGELLQPELSNLHILTAALGFRLFETIWDESSIDFIYHLYWQVEPAPFLRDVAIDVDPQGEGRTIGQEWDLVISIQHFTPFEMNLSSSIFRSGSAYGPLSGKTAYKVALEVNLSF